MKRLTVVLFVAALLIGAASAAWAHASLVASDPGDGSVVATSPGVLALTFNEPVSPVALRLIDDQGVGSDLANVRVEGNTVLIVPPAAIGEGTHSLSWRVISADGHPVGGSLMFSIGAPSARVASMY